MQVKIGDFKLPDAHPLAKAIVDMSGGDMPMDEPTNTPADVAQTTTNDAPTPTPVAPQAGKLPPGAIPMSGASLVSDKDNPVVSLEQAIADAKQSAEMTYEDRLAENKITPAEAHAIIDAVITKGYYEKTYQVTKTVRVTFRSRTMGNQEKLLDDLEQRQLGYKASIDTHIAKHNLAASLVALGPKGKETRFDAEELETTLKFVSALPMPYYVMLLQKLGAFERLLFTVMDAGAIENF